MTRRNWLYLPTILLVLLATPAFAAEGGLSIFPDLKMMLALIALFIVLIWPANKLLFQPLLGTLDERGKRIEGARERAARVAGEADEVLGRYEAAVDVARRAADSDRKERLESARQELARVTGEARGAAEEEVSQARQQVHAAVDDARRTLREESERLGREAAARVLGRELS